MFNAASKHGLDSLIHLAAKISKLSDNTLQHPPGGGVLPYMGYIGMCGPKGYGFSTVLIIDRVSILANFGHFGHKWGMVFAL